MNSTPEKRPLGSLTPAECQVIFTLAFDKTIQISDPEIISQLGPVTITGGAYELILYPGGSMMASWLTSEDEGLSISVNAARIVVQLAQWHIEFGPQLPTSL